MPFDEENYISDALLAGMLLIIGWEFHCLYFSIHVLIYIINYVTSNVWILTLYIQFQFMCLEGLNIFSFTINKECATYFTCILLHEFSA
jgi:hypothetical protein